MAGRGYKFLSHHPADAAAATTAPLLVAGVILLSLIAGKLYDEPLRTRLSARFRRQQAAPATAAGTSLPTA